MKSLENKPIWLYVFFALIVFMAGSIFMLRNGKNEMDKNVHITIDGKEYVSEDEENISLDVDKLFTVNDGYGGLNTILIHNGDIRVASANCPDKVCIKKGNINRKSFGDMIICAPHRLVISIY